MINRQRLEELLLQSLEHEQGGVTVYETALECALDYDLREEWQEYLEQTKDHVQIVQDLCRDLEIDTGRRSPGRIIVHNLGEALVEAMRTALGEGDAEAAQLVACECVVLAETKDHLNWELLGKCAEKSARKEAVLLEAATDVVAEEEDEHLYHTKGWCRELWLQALGMKAVLPPPEGRKHVRTAIGAARAQAASEKNR